jgi:PAS domain S-box-containing protein
MDQSPERKLESRPTKILLVEDDCDAARVINELVGVDERTFDIEWADHLHTALEKISRGGIDLVLLDLARPDGRSWDTLVRVQTQSPNLPIIVLTGSNDESLALKAVQLGAQDHLFKGELTRQLLVRAVRYAIERKRAVSALRDSENRFRALFEKSWDGVALLSSGGIVVYASPAITRIVGYEINEYTGTNAFEYLHPDDKSPVLRLFIKMMSQVGSNITVQYRYRHKDGSWRWIECTATNLLSEPSVQAVVCNYHDITDTREADQALRESEERFRALIEHSWDGVLLLTSTVEIIYASPSTHRILGHVGDDLITRNAFALMHPEDFPNILRQFQVLLTRPKETLTAEFRYQHKEGDWRWLECTGTNLLNNPSVRALVINYRDITERKVNEAELRQARDELEQRVTERTAELSEANASLTQQIIERRRVETELTLRNQKLAQLYEWVEAGREQLQRLSHRLVEVQEQERRGIARELHDEVGQVLTGLKMTLEVIKRLPPEAATAAFDQALNQVNELLALVRKLSLDLRPAMLDDLGLLPTLFWHFDRYSAQTKIQVNFKHSGVEGRYAPELETAIYRIVQEALTNVARHSKVSEARVLLWTTHETIGVQVEDRGVGFKSESVLASGHSSGLTGMRERAGLLGGKFTVESSESGGTCVTAEMPLINPAHQRADQSERAGQD